MTVRDCRQPVQYGRDSRDRDAASAPESVHHHLWLSVPLSSDDSFGRAASDTTLALRILNQLSHPHDPLAPRLLLPLLALL